MGIQSFSLQPTRLLERNDLWPSPLGNVGNLRYSTEQGGTPRVSVPGALWSVTSRIVGFWAFCLTCPSEQVSRTHSAVMQAHYNSVITGNLLGYLTARPDDLESRTKLVEWLAEASSCSNNDLSRLVGWRHSLLIFMRELTDADVRALCDGILGSPSATAAVLNQISCDRDDPLRGLASQMLSQIETELQKRVARDFMRMK